jgi:hypothetical protein
MNYNLKANKNIFLNVKKNYIRIYQKIGLNIILTIKNFFNNIKKIK